MREELEKLIAEATPGDLSTAELSREEVIECPVCGGDGEVDAVDYCNFDHKALGVQFYGIGKEFGAHEKLWSYFMNNAPTILEALTERASMAAEIERLRAALSNPPKHKFWGAGEPDCPRELKAGNGELRTLRCKVCGEDNPRDSICRWAIGTRESDSDAAMRFIDKLRADYGTVTILPDNEEADTKAEQMAIDCCGEWTNWQDQRFYGETVVQCLAKAVTVKAKAAALLMRSE